MCSLLSHTSSNSEIVRAALGVIARFLFAPNSSNTQDTNLALSSRLYLSKHVDSLLKLCDSASKSQDLGLVRDASTVMSLITENDPLFCYKISSSELFPLLLSTLTFSINYSEEMCLSLFDNDSEAISEEMFYEKIAFSLHLPVLKILFNMASISPVTAGNNVKDIVSFVDGEAGDAETDYSILIKDRWKASNVLSTLFSFLGSLQLKGKSNLLGSHRLIASAALRVIFQFVSHENVNSIVEELREKGGIDTLSALFPLDELTNKSSHIHAVSFNSSSTNSLLSPHSKSESSRKSAGINKGVLMLSARHQGNFTSRKTFRRESLPTMDLSFIKSSVETNLNHEEGEKILYDFVLALLDVLSVLSLIYLYFYLDTMC